MKRFLVACFFLGMVSVGLAQGPVMLVDVKQENGEKSRERLGISKVKAEAKINGFLAETKMTFVFYNPHNTELQGEFIFPLPEGATVSGYGLDIGDKMVDGVIVEKDKGRRVFEEISRRPQVIDPGLVEWLKGNHYRTRVYPIFAKKTRTVSISYLSQLTQDSSGMKYILPVTGLSKVKEFELSISVDGAAATPTLRNSAMTGLQFVKDGNAYRAMTKLTNTQLKENIDVFVPAGTESLIVTGKDASGETFFCIHDKLAFPAGEETLSQRKIGVLWDASGSRKSSDLDRELRLLELFAGKANDGKATIELTCFRNTADRLITLSGKALQSDLKRAISRVAYDGGTNLAFVDKARSGDCDFYILFSDGVNSFGPSLKLDLKGKPVFVISSSMDANYPLLRRIAAATGGAYFNLLNCRDDQVVALLGKTPFVFQGVKVDSGQISEVYPEGPVPVQNSFQVAGKLGSSVGRLTLLYGFAGRTIHRKSFTIDAKEAPKGSLVSRFWAQQKVNDLMLDRVKNGKEIAQVGVKYGLVTPSTSLIVLESLTQYLDYDIEPPESLPEMRERFLARRSRWRNRRGRGDEDPLRIIKQSWDQRVMWWNTVFKYKKGFKYNYPYWTGGRSWADGDDDDFFDAEETFGAFGESPGAAMGVTGGGGYFGGAAAAAGDPRGASLPQQSGPKVEMQVKPWNPDVPYIHQLLSVPAENTYGQYLKLRKAYGKSPYFFVDCSGVFLKKGQRELAIRILSNLAEMGYENEVLLRILAGKLREMKAYALAEMVYREILAFRNEEPQSYRDLALMLELRGDADPKTRKRDYQEALSLLAKVATTRWDRFRNIRDVALMEFNHLLPKARKAGVTEVLLPEELIKSLDADLRVVATWDADMANVDLNVTEPSTERVSGGHSLSMTGGHHSLDIADGYGPEEYFVRKAMPGVYMISVNYRWSRTTELLGPVTVTVEVFTNYGRVNEKRQTMVLRLPRRGRSVQIGAVKLGGDK